MNRDQFLVQLRQARQRTAKFVERSSRRGTATWPLASAMGETALQVVVSHHGLDAARNFVVHLAEAVERYGADYSEAPTAPSISEPAAGRGLLSPTSTRTLDRDEDGNATAPPDPRIESAAVAGDLMVVEFDDGRGVIVPLDWFPTLRSALPRELEELEVETEGLAVIQQQLGVRIDVLTLLGRVRSGGEALS